MTRGVRAGLAGHGGSSYIDTVVLRDKDNNGGGGWTGTPDGIREQRHYYAQNWRADVSVIVDNAGDIQEWDKYRAYGVPFLLTPADHNKDGTVTKDDSNAFDADYAAGNLRADLNKSGTITTADQTIFNASYAKAVVGGRWKLSAPDIANRKGYAGYEHDGDGGVPELAHVRHRVLHFGLGRWTRRDPMGYVDGSSQLQYANPPLTQLDPFGLFGNAGFVLWYYVGNGATLDLGSAGLGQAYENHPAIRPLVAGEVARVRAIAQAKAEAMADGYHCDCYVGPQVNYDEFSGTKRLDVSRSAFVQASPSGQGPLEEMRWFWDTDWTFSIGGHFLYADHECHFGVECGYCSDGESCEVPRATHIRWWFSCDITFRMRDHFSDPLDVLETLRKLRDRTGISWPERGYVQNILPHTPGNGFDIQYDFGRGFGGDGLKIKDHTQCILSH